MNMWRWNQKIDCSGLVQFGEFPEEFHFSELIWALWRRKTKQKQKRESNKIGENRLFSLKITSIGSESFSLTLHSIGESGKIFAFSKCISHSWNQLFLLWNQFLSLSLSAVTLFKRTFQGYYELWNIAKDLELETKNFDQTFSNSLAFCVHIILLWYQFLL